MPTIITHGIVGLAGGNVLHPRERLPLSFWALCIILPVLPDFDALAFRFGIPYGSDLGHRGVTHSILFAATAGGFAALLVRSSHWGKHFHPLRWFSFFFLLTLTHTLLDACTDGGFGVEFFWPFSGTRYFSFFRPIKVAPIAVGRFFSRSIIPVLLSEALWVWVPLAVAVTIVKLLRHRTPGSPPPRTGAPVER